MFAAGNGDSILFQHSAGDTVTLLIDGGYTSSIRENVLPILNNLREANVSLDLLIATHIDADHINGIVTLLKENVNTAASKIVQIDRVWHNSLRSLAIVEDKSKGIATGDREILEEIKARGFETTNHDKEPEISAKQGSSLAHLLTSGGYCWNEGEGKTSIRSGSHFELPADCHITVITPSEDRLFSLRDWWIKEVQRLGYTGPVSSHSLIQDAFEFMCSFELPKQINSAEEISATIKDEFELGDIYEADTSITNGSSISFVLKAGKNQLLFLGDAWAEEVIRGLKKISGLLLPFTFDAIKISHHGSYRNTSPELLELIDSPHYLISTNGEKHFHPDVAVLKAIVDRPANFERHLYFNYNTPASNYMKSYTSKLNMPFSIHVGKNIQLTMDN